MVAPVLALVPGLNNTRAVWDGVVAALGDRVQCVSVDCPALDTVEEVADALLAQLPQRFWLAGFSFGGYVALAMLERAPQRVAGLALVNSSTRADSDAQRAARAKSISTAQAGGHEAMMAAQAPVVFHPASLSNAALMRARGAMVRDYGPERFVAHLHACASRPDRSLALAEAACPLLLVAAADDRVVPTALQKLTAEAVPRARFVEIADAGHMLPMEQPQALAAALQSWLVEFGVPATKETLP
jgi:pimeloyl-ACP methyl ester carboxylesterase